MALNDILTSMDGARDALVTAINAKGGSLADNATFYQCADAVGSLSGGTSAEYYKCASVSAEAATPEGATFTMQLTLKALSITSTYHWVMDDTSKTGTERTWTGTVKGDSGTHTLHFNGTYWQVVDGLGNTTATETADDPWDITNWHNADGGDVSCTFSDVSSASTGSKTWSGYKAVFDSGTGTWSFESNVTEGLTYTSVTPVVGSTYSSDGMVMVVLYSRLFYGLLGYYRFNGDADNAVNQNANGAAQNVIYVEGKNGRAVQFDGSTSQVNLPKIVSVRGCYQASISVWFKINSLGNKNVIYAEENSLKYFYRFGCEVASDGKVSAYMRNFDSSASSIGITGDTIEFGKWYFLVMKFDANTQSFAMYLDGRLVDTKTTTANPIPDTAPGRNICVGSYTGSTASDTGVIDGVVDELGIWSRALSDAEVSELYNNGAGKFL